MKYKVIFFLFFITVLYSQELFAPVEADAKLMLLPKQNSFVLSTIPIGHICIQLKKGKEETINEISGNWLYVKTTSNKRGWVFSGELLPFIQFESQHNYSIKFPQDWLVRENEMGDLIQLQINSYDDAKYQATCDPINDNELRIDIFIYFSIPENFEKWARSFDYIDSISINKENPDEIFGISKAQGYTIQHTILKMGHRGVIMTFFPPQSKYSKIAKIIFDSFFLTE